MSVSSVREQYNTFFERIMVFYNLALSKEEKDHNVKDVKRFAIELYETGRISEYTKDGIDDALDDFSSLLSVQSKKWAIDLDYLDARISLATSSINAEIGALIH